MPPDSAQRVIINIDRFGNTTVGTIPLAMQTAREENKLNNGDLILLASVGAGGRARVPVKRCDHAGYSTLGTRRVNYRVTASTR